MNDQFREQVEQLKEQQKQLELHIPLPQDEAEDRAMAIYCSNVFDILSKWNMTYEQLKETMIGKTVSAFKKHPTLGPKAKVIVRNWKKIAKDAEEADNTPTTAAASAAPAAKPSAVKAAKASAAQVPKPKPAVRRSSTASSVASSAPEVPPSLVNAESEWIGLAGMRQNICKKFFELLLSCRQALIQEGINAEAVDHLLPPRAAEIESALWSLANGDKKSYADKARSLVFNLRKNKPLTQRVILGQVSSETLVNLKSEDLVSSQEKETREKAAEKLIESKRLDWETANEAKINEQCGIKGDLLNASLFTCGRCKSTKTTSTQKQTRSADEPMTVFVLCLNCGKRWKC